MNPVPEDFHTLTPHLCVRDVPKAIAFLTVAFGAHELVRNRTPDGKVMHAELLIGDSRLFVNEEFPEHGVLPPLALGGTAVTLHLYVADVDAVATRAIAAGATVALPVADQPWGDRYGILVDPFGHRWSVASRLEDLSPGDMKRRAEAAFS
jgi:PhnB protein